MTHTKIIAHCVVRNEERWIWYAINSVLDFVDKLVIYDTGSTDKTVEIIKKIESKKIEFKIFGITKSETDLSKIRQKMLDSTSNSYDWLLILDGDEVWPDLSMVKINDFITKCGSDFDSIVVPTLNCVGDVYHVSPPNAGRYEIAGRIGHYNLRLINLRRIPGLYVSNPPGQLQSYFDAKGIKVQDRNPKKIAFVDAPYLHMTHLQRSGERINEVNVFWRAVKRKVELGLKLSKRFDFPRCFYLIRPKLVHTPWDKRSLFYVFNALWQTPLKILKRLLI